MFGGQKAFFFFFLIFQFEDLVLQDSKVGLFH